MNLYKWVVDLLSLHSILTGYNKYQLDIIEDNLVISLSKLPVLAVLITMYIWYVILDNKQLAWKKRYLQLILIVVFWIIIINLFPIVGCGIYISRFLAALIITIIFIIKLSNERTIIINKGYIIFICFSILTIAICLYLINYFNISTEYIGLSIKILWVKDLQLQINDRSIFYFLFFILILIYAIAEELLYRAFLLIYIKDKSLVLSILLNAFLWYLAHGVQFVYFFISAIVLCLIQLRLKNIWLTIYIHFAMNLFIIFSLIYQTHRFVKIVQ